MSLSAELARAFPRIPHPALSKRKCALEIEADKAALAFGGVAPDPAPSDDKLARVEALLAQPGGLSKLGRSELKLVPYVIWGADTRWRNDRGFIRSYLSEVDARWPTGLRRIWRHYMLNFDPNDPATIEVAQWFRTKQQRLPELLKGFTDTYRLFDVSKAADTMAAASIKDEQFLLDIAAVGLTTAVVRSSALCVSTLAAVGRQLSSLPGSLPVVQPLRRLLDGHPENAIAEALCTDTTRQGALRSLVDGLVEWQERSESKEAAPETVLDFLLALNGDPRFTPDRWNARVSPRSVAAVERWLSRKTIEVFFRVIDALRTDRPDMWQGRRAFWLSYLPHVSKAWLVVGPDAVPIAEKEGLRFAKFMAGSGAQYNQCGLLLQIRETCIMEMNKNGSAIFWRSNARGLPGLYEASYSRNQYRNVADGKNVVVLTHQGDWQRKFRAQILTMTGVNVRGQ